jgi:hypothetical protein
MGGSSFARRLGTSYRSPVRSGVLFQRIIDPTNIEPASADRHYMSVPARGIIEQWVANQIG